MKNMENTDTTALTVDEVAGKLSLTNKTIRKHIKSGKIPAKKIGKRWYISEEDFEKIFAEYMTT
ncbi:helix-turn-helix domain-containing protein [Mangrovibacterium marinum]|uniref:Excisionase family DNA binding protein n=1 Tax=Mangrovibacterium marinum TaxID=1639118 RepID=A0A2T5C093_9BACT|nr:helix-turn-helix domain-containing protein [Mangrovibacterium marinum]PTN07987.1 excisionase family DNA binding protein [Mangrovibacterium marinum]